MANPHCLRLVIAPADLDAHLADLEAIFARYGDPETVAPHNRKALEAELRRAGQTLVACFEWVAEASCASSP